MNMALVKIVTEDGTALRERNIGKTMRDMSVTNYFEMTVPVVGTLIKYHKFNKYDYFEGEFVTYEVLKVIQELQESWNGAFEERYTAVVVER